MGEIHLIDGQRVEINISAAVFSDPHTNQLEVKGITCAYKFLTQQGFWDGEFLKENGHHKVFSNYDEAARACINAAREKLSQQTIEIQKPQ